jgi:ribosomal protein S18 acetylase RimI-like enzyme
MIIVEAQISDLTPFFDYLENQLAENGVDKSPLFMPVARDKKSVSPQTKKKFEDGFSKNLDDLRFRKLWLAKDSLGKIIGHIDLRHHNDEHCLHRVLLGMGVGSNHRKKGIGEQLIREIIHFCYDNSNIDWLDLNVLSMNVPAKKLYLKCAFEIVGEISDYYRIEGDSVSEITMTKNVKSSTH